MAHQDRRQLGVITAVDNVPHVQDVPEQPQSDGLISGNILEHGQVEVETNGLGVVQTESPLAGHDSLSLQLDRGGDIESSSRIGILVLGSQLGHAHPDELVHGSRVLVVGGGDLGMDDLVSLLIHIDTLEHELETERHVSTAHRDSTGLKDLFSDGGLRDVNRA